MDSIILFIPTHLPSLLEMLPIAKKLAEDGIHVPVFFLYRDIPNSHVEQLRRDGIRVIGPKANSVQKAVVPESGASKTGQKKSFRAFLKDFLQKALRVDLFAFFWYLTEYGYQTILATKLIRTENVRGLVVVGDRHVGWETTIIKVANRYQIPSLIVPFAVSDPRGAVEYRLRHSNVEKYQLRTWLDRWVGRLFPKWVIDSQSNRLFFIPVGNALAARIWDVMPESPWVLGGGAATYMAVESPRLMKNFQQQGTQMSKMVVTGKSSTDQIYEVIQASNQSKIKKQLGIPPDRPILLCSVPQLGEHGILPWSEHWKEIEFLFETLTKQNLAQVVVSLHPKSNPQDYYPLIEKYGIIFSDHRIYGLIPECDLFVATYSSTIVQAIGLGKPAVVVDFYGLDYQFYDQEPGILVIKERDLLLSTIERILGDREYYNQLAEAQTQRAAEWILLDGYCTQRIMDKIYQMVEQ